MLKLFTLVALFLLSLRGDGYLLPELQARELRKQSVVIAR